MGDGQTGAASDILHVPVAVCSASMVALRTARLPSGERVGLAFTSEARLAEVYGMGQPWILLHLKPLRAMLRPRGITKVLIDPLGWGPGDGAGLGETLERSSEPAYSRRNIPASA